MENKGIEEMLQIIINAHFDQNAHEYVADPARAICTALFIAGYRRLRKDMSKEKGWTE